MAAGREAASAAAIEVILDGYFFWVQVKKGPGTYKRTMDTGNQQSWRRFRRFTMRHTSAISPRASVAPFAFVSLFLHGFQGYI